MIQREADGASGVEDVGSDHAGKGKQKGPVQARKVITDTFRRWQPAL